MDLGADIRLPSPQTRISLRGCSCLQKPLLDAVPGPLAEGPHRSVCLDFTEMREGISAPEGSARGLAPVSVTVEDREGSNPLGQ